MGKALDLGRHFYVGTNAITDINKLGHDPLCQEVQHNWDSLHVGPSWCQHYDTESAGSGMRVLDGGSLCRMYI